ncbi:Fasciclin domain-containing protein [Cephalotus follicularis]|uniref:Fasciclin domain-containing protein n=1 Tax=Cephalotus follicularis TaxID=3775 RepID=A0A1Q3CJK8_CEPFO|nr:Fasciclin domain-containing protein [Cephalotus follicularis]
MATKLLICLLLSLLSLSTSLSLDTIEDAAEILSNSGFISMSLTLQLLSETLTTPQSKSLTLFSPSDHAFALHGQPPLSLLQLHFSPLSLSLQSLKSLPQDSKIPTLSPNHSLVITSSPSDDFVSLNGVKIDGSPIFDSGSLTIFGTDDFFNPDFRVSGHNQSHGGSLGCVVPSSVDGSGFNFGEASGALRSRGCSFMASFLDLQVMRFMGQSPSLLTLFAPVDDAMVGFVGNFSDYSSLFFRHLLPCKLEWNDLVGFNNGTELGTYLEGFGINVTSYGDAVMVNDVLVMSPDMYYSDGVVIHGLNEVLKVPERPQEMAESFFEIGSYTEENEQDNGEF